MKLKEDTAEDTVEGIEFLFPDGTRFPTLTETLDSDWVTVKKMPVQTRAQRRRRLMAYICFWVAMEEYCKDLYQKEVALVESIRRNASVQDDLDDVDRYACEYYWCYQLSVEASLRASKVLHAWF